MLYFDAFIP